MMQVYGHSEDTRFRWIQRRLKQHREEEKKTNRESEVVEKDVEEWLKKIWLFTAVMI